MAVQTCDTLIHARWVITVDDEHRVLEHHAVVINDGRIEAIVPSDTCTFTGKQTLNLPEHALLPGLINSHCHAAMSLFRGLADDMPLMEWLSQHIWPAEAKWVDEHFVRDGVELAMAEMIRGGITCFSDMYFFPNVVARAAHDAQMRAQITCPIIDFPSAWAANVDEYIHKAVQLIDDFRCQERIRIGFGPHAPYTVSDDGMQKALTLAEEIDCVLHIHLHETAAEVDEAVTKSGVRPFARLHRLGLLGPSLQTVHMTQLTDGEINTLANTGTHVIHCPESNLKLASGFCPVTKLMNSGVNVALGTDGAASNNDLDMWSEMRTAALLAKGVSGNPAALPAQAALQMATRNGAKAMGIEHLCGSLEPGKSADMIAVNMTGVEMEPAYHPISQLVYATGRHQVSHSWVEGVCLMQDRTLLTLNEADILARARAWRERIQETP